MTGIVANTNYIVATIPTTTQFTLTGISSLGGTVGSAYYFLKTRALANISTAGGVLQILDAANLNNPIVFDTSAATTPVIMRFPLTTSNRIEFPSFGGAVAVLANSQTFTGAKTFSGQLIATRAGQTSSASANFLSQPASTAMTGSNSYFWNYFSTPTTTGSSTGTAATVHIQGAPTTAAANNYAFQIIGGQTSIPNGTVSAPSMVFATGNNSSGFYSSGANVINTSISGVNIWQVNSTGGTISGILSASNSLTTPIIRPISGTSMQLGPSTNNATGSVTLRVTPSTAGWSSGGTANIELGDANRFIQAVNGTGSLYYDLNAINFSSGVYNFYDTASSYFMIGALNSDPIGANTYGLNFGSGSSEKSLNIYNNNGACMKLGTSTDSEIVKFYRNNPSVVKVGNIAVTTTGTSYNTLSDRRAKKNIIPVKDKSGDDPITQLEKINVYEYEFKEDSSKMVGFLADELSSVLPQAVTLASSASEFDMVDYSKLVPLLVAAVQDLNKEIKKLKK